jgi:hypothetical protein
MPPRNIRWGLLHDAQNIRISMYLSLIWQIFYSEIVWQKIFSGVRVFNALHAHSLTCQAGEGRDKEDEGGA